MNSIRPYNTFRVDHTVGDIIQVTSLEQLSQYLLTLDNPIIIGGGSNILFRADTSRSVLLLDIKGIEVQFEDEKNVEISVGAGEVWHDVVMWTIEREYGGLENLSLIPGKCGAAPMQNIGAYGVELSQHLVSVTCMDRRSGDVMELTAAECKLGYRDSIFKSEFKDKYIITTILLSLNKKAFHKVNISYGDIQGVLTARGIADPSIKEVSDAVIDIRSSKLPNPELLPNAGSFFKNPIIPTSFYEALLVRFPNMPSYPVSAQYCKVPAGWLIDKCGWKGIMVGNVGVHNRQALVIVNHGTRDGQDIVLLAQLIQKSVFEEYDIQLEMEVNLFP